MLDPIRVHVLRQVIHKAQERIQLLAVRRLRPVLKLVDFLRHGTTSMLPTDTAPKLQLCLVELSLQKLELKPSLPRFCAQFVEVLHVLFKRSTTHTDIVHQRGTIRRSLLLVSQDTKCLLDI